MNWIDVVIVVIVVIGAIQGYRSGFLMELFSLLGILLGILIGFKLMGVMLVFLSVRFDLDEKMLPYIAFFVVFIAVLIIVTLIGRILRASIDKSFLGRVDEAAGSLLGVFKTIFILSILLWLAGAMKVRAVDELSADSTLVPYVSEVAPLVGAWVGEWFPSLNDIF